MDTKQYSDQLLSYGTKYVEDSMRAWERYLQGFSKATGGEAKLDGAQQRFTDFARKDGVDTALKLTKINYDYCASVMNAYLDYSESALAAASVKGGEGNSASEASEGAKEADDVSKVKHKNIDLQFTAKKGRVQKQAFVVANNNLEDAEVSFEISELICEDGKSKVAAPVTFKPDRFVLKQGAEQVVECRLKLTKTLKAELQYVALARVVGFENLFVRLIVDPK